MLKQQTTKTYKSRMKYIQLNKNIYFNFKMQMLQNKTPPQVNVFRINPKNKRNKLIKRGITKDYNLNKIKT